MKQTRPAEDHLEVARVLLLLQGAILVATTIEALVWGAAFPAAGGPVVMSGLAAVAILVARIRLGPDRRWPRRLIYIVEGVTLVAFTVDLGLAVVLTHGLPPVVALLTQLLLPICVIVLLRRAAHAPVMTDASSTAGVPDIWSVLEGAP